MFKRLNPQVQVTDISSLLNEMKIIKNEYELEAIKRAGEIAGKVLKNVEELVKPGISETEIAGEIYRSLYKMGFEHPLVYVNAGPYPCIHAEPFSDNIVVHDTFVSIVVGADYNGYYANKSISIYVGEPRGRVSRIIECMEKVYEKAYELTKPGVRLIDVMHRLGEIYKLHDLINHRVEGYTHGVGLKIEETPITTIVPKHCFISGKENMVLAYVHAPIVIEKLGQIKFEDTFIITRSKSLKIT